jgi:hypothetical protein
VKSEIEIQSKSKFSEKAKAKYNRNKNIEGYPTLVKRVAPLVTILEA